MKELHLVGWRSDYEGHPSKEATKEFKISWYHLQSHMKSHEKESIRLIALSPNISSLEDEARSSSFFICN